LSSSTPLLGETWNTLLSPQVYDQLRKIWPRGPDVGIEAVGNHYHEGSLLHKVEQAVSGETDPSEMLNEIIYSTRKVRFVLVVGVFFLLVLPSLWADYSCLCSQDKLSSRLDAPAPQGDWLRSSCLVGNVSFEVAVGPCDSSCFETTVSSSGPS
jgi:hypothetical protein